MRRSGFGSWRFAQSTEQLLHVLLYTRARLGIETDASFPPPLLDGIARPDGAADQSGEISSLWQDWWDGHVAQAAMLQGAERVSDSPRCPQWAEDLMRSRPPTDQLSGSPWRTTVADHISEAPPDYPDLDPLLRPTAVSSWPDAKRWTSEHARNRPPDETELPFPLIARTAQRVVVERDVDPVQLTVVLLPLAVQGVWWDIWGPGIALCSFECISRPDVGEAIAYEACSSCVTESE